ncbi:protein kinase [Nocardioidaceae bacterium]|nr:protein kinase [Nocardioidaceae bacterium]
MSERPGAPDGHGCDPADVDTQVAGPSEHTAHADALHRDRSDPMVGMEVLGCRLLAPVGSGASGTVFRARQLRLDRDVAVKLVPASSAGVATVERFRREVRAIAALDHPSVVPVHDAGEEDGLLVLVMKLIDGVDLRALVAERGAVDAGAAVAVVAQVADALDVAHAAGLVHRDVKPANVLLSRGRDRRAYLADFGLARSQHAEDTVTAESSWVGTPAYASPEQRAGAEVGPASDRYSLAGLLAFLVTGAAPGAEVDRDLLDPTAAAVLRVADRGMAAAPADRFDSAAALARAARAAAEEAAAGVEVTSTLPRPHDAHPVDATDAAHEARDQRRLTAALVVAVVLVGAGFAAAVHGLVAPDRQADDPAGDPSAAVPTASASVSSGPSPAPGSDPGSDPRPSDSTTAAADESRLPPVAVGDEGPVVRAAQLLLQARGLQVAATGTWDAASADGLSRFTAARLGVPAESVDDAAWSELLLTQVRGDTGPAVQAVQELLVASGAALEVDGRYFDATEAAVESFQAERFLETDGEVGDNTWAALLQAAVPAGG